MPRAAPRGLPVPQPASRSGAGPSPRPSLPVAPGAVPSPARAACGEPDFAGRPLRASGECSSRPASPPGWSADSAGPGTGSSGPIPSARWRRSPPCAVASERQAPRASFASGGEPTAPLRASSGEHASTALRSHAGAEAVFPLPCALLGLIGPLHRGVLRPRSAAASCESGGNIRRAGVTPASRDSRFRLVSLCAAILPQRPCAVSNAEAELHRPGRAYPWGWVYRPGRGRICAGVGETAREASVWLADPPGERVFGQDVAVTPVGTGNAGGAAL